MEMANTCSTASSVKHRKKKAPEAESIEIATRSGSSSKAPSSSAASEKVA